MNKKRKFKLVWSCSDFVKHEHKTYVGAVLCGWRQRLTQRALDGVPPREAGDLTPDDIRKELAWLPKPRRQ